jgi:uracil-DNA glycosylase
VSALSDPTPTGAAGYPALAARIESCTACALAASRRTVVVGSGPVPARLLLVGEAPGAQEDVTGVPFVGRAGQLLDRLLTEADLIRGGVAVSNVVKCRPPGNRVPSRSEVATCRGWLVAQLTVIDPRVIVTLGGTATAAFLGRGLRLVDVRGRTHDVDGRRVLPTYHPSAALRFGPAGAPLGRLREDLALAAELVR